MKTKSQRAYKYKSYAGLKVPKKTSYYLNGGPFDRSRVLLTSPETFSFSTKEFSVGRYVLQNDSTLIWTPQLSEKD